ncbi:ribosome silencing factor [Levilactobacillus brevis]|jgi:ribosome-associated protein|uniref:Ribosomal silencing factor RsfS n=3 Tax=Levilactobacillus brevis TaxID=1580 RepID=Q03RL2_LEVBA|nr:ribosome silencing factor [Levilactobacillus brevis]MBL3536526.1 ribosome silencing factor [Lactobacillus sp. GPR40-2]MBL3629684.1 ribosome silencing factor [Lactobacillus sp. GPB7-4]ABJ64160.1 Iojap family protein [Levilactobacillus brevis ATCC 367]ARQ93789.1 ribosome silencing factor RsfS [Levilactobacillus brevis]ARW21943.1 Ribosomal silencing factor RsfS [Levilactobacillus brevis]
MESKEILEIAVKAAENKRAEDLTALDMTKVSLMADYFLIMEANSSRQIQAIADEITDQMAANGVKMRDVEGKNEANWILIDLGDVVVHVFQKEQRSHYNLEKLWSDAPTVDLGQWVEA